MNKKRLFMVVYQVGYLLNLNDFPEIFMTASPSFMQNVGLDVTALILARTQTKPDILMSFLSSRQLASLRKTFTGQG